MRMTRRASATKSGETPNSRKKIHIFFGTMRPGHSPIDASPVVLASAYTDARGCMVSRGMSWREFGSFRDPASVRPTGCLRNLELENGRWTMSPTRSQLLMRVAQWRRASNSAARVVQLIARMERLSDWRGFRSRERKLPYSGPSFPRRSTPSSMLTIRCRKTDPR